MFRDPRINTYVNDVENTIHFYTEFPLFSEAFRTRETGPPERSS